MEEKLQPGRIVSALVGRDQGRFFVITEVCQGFVYLADGQTRKLAKAKKKNSKHIRLTLEKITVNNSLTDSQLRKALSSYNKSII